MSLGLAKYIPRLEPSLATYIAVTGACFLPAIVLGIYLLFDIRSRQADPIACRKIGLRIQSQLADQHDKRYSRLGAEQQNGTASWKVKSLWIYPIKSCKGVELNKGTVLGTGMEYDRQFCFAQLSSKFPTSLDTPQAEKAEHKWKFLTQRLISAMATIKTEVWIPDFSSPTYSATHPNVRSGGVLVIRFPKSSNNRSPWGRLVTLLTSMGHTPEHCVQIPFDPTPEQITNSGYTTDSMEIWKDSPKSLTMASTENGDEWIQELRFYLGITNHLALVRVSKDDLREVYRCAPRKEELGYQSKVGFQDAYPLHLLNLASVHDIGRMLSKDAPPLGALNFRPNIVITGGTPYAEDSWKRIKIGEYEYYVACRTVRCLLPNVNPATGIKHGSEPNKTLKTYRCVDEGDPKNACLGMQMVPALEDSKIKVGDTVEILETGEHFYIRQ
ncbi:hypothetical protein N7G274_006938 [Stereocaulon virgatum]|uniref:MOSC domain-containing protein n=1 Tax=Stereocaulon virgatum TaxID=373712 RepID=A0ABR4A4X9_9LECA